MFYVGVDFVPRFDVAHRDVAVLNGSDRIGSHGASNCG
jgi:hypothetical protein